MRSSWGFPSAAAAAVVAIAVLAAPALLAQPPAALFVDTASPATTSVSRDTQDARRARRLAVRPDAIRVLLAAGTDARSPFALNLFGDATLTIVRERLETGFGGHTTWVGHVEGDPESTVALTWDGATLSGSVVTGGAVYALLPDGVGTVLVTERQSVPPPVELPSLEPPDTADARTFAGAGPLATAQIDLLVIYTPAARTRAGGSTSQIQSQLVNAVAATNTAFQRSGIDAVFNTVGIQEVAYAEAAGGLSADLNAITSDATLASLRNTLGADLVALVTGRTSTSGGCGVAWLGPSSSSYGFSVSEQACLYAGQWTFSHELGHNFGARHAPGDSSDTTPSCQTYACGYREGSIRTLMAYYVSGSASQRILNFSSASVLEGGLATGNSLRDNARKIGESAAAVAGYRSSTPGPQLPAAPTGLNAAVAGQAVGLSWNATATATSYRLQVGVAPGDSSILDATQAGVSRVLTSLQARTYYWRVRAMNAAGTGPASAEGTFIVQPPPSVPGVPRQLAAAVNGSTVTLTWLPPDGGGPVTSYELEAGSQPGLANVLRTAVGASPLVAGNVPTGTYYVRLRSVGPGGTGAPTADVAVVVAGCVPPGPLALSGSQTGGVISLSWTTPTGTAPFSYILGAGSVPGAVNIGIFPMGGALGLTTAVPPGAYYVKAVATNACGMGPISNEVLVTVP